MQEIKENLLRVKERIALTLAKYQHNSSKVNLIAVSKFQSLDKIKAAILAGQLEFGESYLDEAIAKIKILNDHRLIWHYIGRIQSKKAKLIAEYFQWVDSVSRVEEAELLSKYRISQTPLNLCIQVNISSEESKNGVSQDQVAILAKKIVSLPNLKLRGLMAIPAYKSDFDQQFLVFSQLKLLFDQLNFSGAGLDTLNIGMSHDFESAIKASSTTVRIGSAIFGDRENKKG